LRNPFPALTVELVIDNPSSKVAFNQPEKTFVPDFIAEVRHQQVMSNPDRSLGKQISPDKNMNFSCTAGEFTVTVKCPHSLATGLLGFPHFT